ncbi:MAG TPA: hypothetical protein VFE60_13520 [Roseiarcus sp.]|nr:hypothetical protein [Roseiarcus sp.]
MARARAEWRAKRAGKTSNSLWEFEKWGDGRTQEHHPGRRKFSGEDIVTIHAAMHPELTRRGEQEHPPLGLDAGNLLERQGRLFLGWSDMFEALADACRGIGENMLAAVNAGHTSVNAVHIPDGLLGWIARIAQYLALATKRAASEMNED